MFVKKDISKKDLNKMVEDTYGEILEDWKEIGLLIEKKIFFEGSIPLFAVPFILENYDLSDDELNILRFSFRDSFEQDTNAVSRIKDILFHKGIDEDVLFGQEVDLTQEQFVFLLKRGIAVKEVIKNADWEFVKDLMKNNLDLLDPFTKLEHTPHYKIIEIFEEMINNVDYSKVKPDDSFFKEFSSIVVDNIAFKKIFENEHFLRNFCLVNAGEYFDISSSLLSNKSIKDKFVAKTLLSFIVKSEKNLFLIENGLIVPERVQFQLNSDSEYAKNHAQKIESLISGFKEKVIRYGDMGGFYLKNKINERKYGTDFYEFKKFLTNQEIDTITDGAVLECIDIKDIPNHLNKIQDEILSHASFLSKINIHPLSFNAFSTYIKFFPEDSEEIIFTPDFIKKLSSIKNSDTHLTFNHYNYLSESNLSGDYLNEYIRRVLKVSSSITEKKESLDNIADYMLTDGLSFIESCLIYKNKKTPSSPEEYKQKKEEAVDLVMGFIKGNRNLLNIQISLKGEVIDDFAQIINSISDHVSFGTNTDELSKEYKNDIATQMIEMNMSFDEVYFYDLFGLNRYKIKGVLTEEESRDMHDLIYLEDLSPLKKKTSIGANVLVDKQIKENQYMMDLVLLTSTYRKKVLDENIFVSAESINNLFESISVIDFTPVDEHEYNKILDIENFVISYMEKNPEQDDLNNIICPKREDGSFKKLDEVISGRQISPDILIANYRKNFNKNAIENILSLYSKENPDSLNSKKAIKLVKAISNESNRLLLEKLVKTINIDLLFQSDLPEKDITKLLLANNQFHKVVKDKILLKRVEKGLGELIKSSIGISEDFKKIVGSFREQDDFPTLISFLRDYAPHTLLSNNLTHIYNNSTTSLITTDDVVLAVKSLADLANNFKDILGMSGLKLDFTFIAPKQDWAGKVEKLSDFEKLLLLKYGTFATYDGSEFNVDTYKDKDLSFIKGSIDNISSKNKAINPMSILIPEVFTEEFFIRNEDIFYDVYLRFNQEFTLEPIRNIPGNISSFLNNGIENNVDFKNSNLWSSALVKLALDVKLPMIGLLPIFESGESVRNELIGNFNLRTEKGITNLFSRFDLSDEKINFTLLSNFNNSQVFKDRINNFNNAIFDTIRTGNVEEQVRFCRIYTAYQLKKDKKTMREEEKMFFQDPKIQQDVHSMMAKHKIENILNISEDFSAEDNIFKI